ncbi:MAG: histidine kinase [Bacteroidetes bacterium]|nr:histidine kinase [Bacteroidota bacterium]
MRHHIVDINISSSAIHDLYLENGQIYFLTKEGIVVSKLNFKNENPDETIFQINQFRVNEIPQQDFQNKTFHHKQNDISIHFSMLDFGSVQLQPLFYKLNDEDWKIISPENRSLQFKALSPGKYIVTFKLGNQILISDVRFIIGAPFWMNWWFILLCITIVSIAVYTYYKWQISLLSGQIKLLNQKVELEQSLGKSILTSIKSQMNPHFFYNALNTIQAYIFTNDKRNASVYLGKFSKLTRMILEMSEQEFIPLQSEIQALTLYLELEKMRFDDDFVFELKVDHSVDVEMIKIPSMLIQPYAENAIKHGLMHRRGNKLLSIQMMKDGQFLKVIIDDNGIGRAKSEEMKKVKQEKHTSFSTRANEQRLEILNKNYKQKVVLEIEDKMDGQGNSLGTQVRLFIPIGL